MIRKHFRRKRIVVGLAFAIFAVAPSAQAMNYIDGQFVAPHRWAQPGVPPAGYVAKPTSAVTVPQTSQISAQPSGFDWGDAGIGASVSFGAALTLLTGVMLSRRYRTRLDRTGIASA